MIPDGAIVPVEQLTEKDILYRSRITRWRYEVLRHEGGADVLAGSLDGMTNAGITSVLNAAVKLRMTATLTDLDNAASGKLAARDIDLVTSRIRPVLLIEGLPEIPWGVYVITAAPEEWTSTGRTYQLELHEKTVVLDQDAVDATFVAPTGTPVLEIVQDVVESAGESIVIDPAETRTLAAAMVWPVGTSKLTIVNDLLSAINYNALWMDGTGRLKATPYVVPASRPIHYDVLGGLPRELVDGETSIYLPDFTRDLDSYDIPNKVVTVSTGGGDDEALTGVATNENPDSPYSYPSRGRWIVRTETGVEVPSGTTGQQEAFLDEVARRSLIAASSVQAAVEVEHLPVPLRVSEVLRFASTPAGVDARHIVVGFDVECAPAGLMRTTLQEAVDL